MSNREDCVLSALAACGRERVWERTGAVAIRWQPSAPNLRVEDIWITGEGATLADAGAQAAERFAERLYAKSKALREWGDRISCDLARARKAAKEEVKP